jgi:hypothetical protein
MWTLLRTQQVRLAVRLLQLNCLAESLEPRAYSTLDSNRPLNRAVGWQLSKRLCRNNQQSLPVRTPALELAYDITEETLASRLYCCCFYRGG